MTKRPPIQTLVNAFHTEQRVIFLQVPTPVYKKTLIGTRRPAGTRRIVYLDRVEVITYKD